MHDGGAFGESRAVRWTLIAITIGFLALFLVLPLLAVFTEALRRGLGLFIETFADDDTQAAIRLTLLVSAIAVPLNLVFGLSAAWAIAKFDFPGKSVLISLIDLPFSVSPVVSGLVYVLLFGAIVDPFDVVFAPNGDMLVVDSKAFDTGGVIRIDHTTGKQTKVASGKAFDSPQGIAINHAGDLFVANDVSGDIVRVDLISGHTQQLADGFDAPEKIIVDAKGDLILASFGDAGENAGTGSIYRIDPLTGASTLISSDDQLNNIAGIVEKKDGTLLTANINSPGLIAIDPKTGAATSVADAFQDSFDVDLLSDNQVIGFEGLHLDRLNLTTGSQTHVSEQEFIENLGLAIVPGGEITNAIPLPAPIWAGMTGFAMIAILSAFRARRRGSRRIPM